MQSNSKSAIRSRAWRAAHPEYQAKWRAAHPGYGAPFSKRWWSAHPNYHAEWRVAHPGYDAEANKKYYATHSAQKYEAFRIWLAKHPGYNTAASKKSTMTKQERLAGRPKPKRCEACGKSGKKICFDHCHKSQKFRGWICHSCNTALGHVKDSTKTLLKLVAYLERCKRGGAGAKPPKE